MDTISNLTLEKSSTSYKMIIPANVEKKIRHLCNKISQVEWSGTLFYTVEGTYEDNNLVITCVDIFPMDIGSSTYTEFDMSPDVISYMTEHPELLDCQLGLIHSHNQMATFFSGTDLNTLKQEGKDRNHFVSLIVNNAGTYTAAITRRITVERTIVSTFTYKSFADQEKKGGNNEVKKEEVIQYNFLEITKETTEDSFPEVDDRLDAIKKLKEEKKKAEELYKASFKPSSSMPFTAPDWRTIPSLNKGNQKSLFDDYYCDSEFMESNPPKQYKAPRELSPDEVEAEIKFDPTLIKTLTLQLLTSSIALADTSRINPEDWCKSMEALFNKRFNGDEFRYNYWMENLVEFVLTDSLPEEYADVCLEDEWTESLAIELYDNIDKLPTNKYIEIIKDCLYQWTTKH
jgi:proteasome lid subunit RPN8/RPN11